MQQRQINVLSLWLGLGWTLATTVLADSDPITTRLSTTTRTGATLAIDGPIVLKACDETVQTIDPVQPDIQALSLPVTSWHVPLHHRHQPVAAMGWIRQALAWVANLLEEPVVEQDPSAPQHCPMELELSVAQTVLDSNQMQRQERVSVRCDVSALTRWMQSVQRAPFVCAAMPPRDRFVGGQPIVVLFEGQTPYGYTIQPFGLVMPAPRNLDAFQEIQSNGGVQLRRNDAPSSNQTNRDGSMASTQLASVNTESSEDLSTVEQRSSKKGDDAGDTINAPANAPEKDRLSVSNLASVQTSQKDQNLSSSQKIYLLNETDQF